MNSKGQLSYMILFLGILMAGMLTLTFVFWNLIRESERTRESGYEIIARQIAWRIDYVATVNETISTAYEIPELDCTVRIGYGRVSVTGKEKGTAMAYYSINPINITIKDQTGERDQVDCGRTVRIKYDTDNITLEI